MTGALQALLAAGVGQPRVSITDQTVLKSAHGTATASYQLVNSGDVVKNGVTLLEHWLKLGSAGDYDVRATQTSGPTISGPLATWVSLASTQGWSLVNSSADNTTIAATMLVEIRDASTLAVLDSATITFQAHSADISSGGG